MMRRFLAISLMLLCFAPAYSASGGRETAVMVVLEGVSLDQLVRWDIPEYRRLIESGAAGLMNNKTGGGQTFKDNAVTVGAGTRGVGGEYAGLGFNAREPIEGVPAGLLFERSTGVKVPQEAVVHTGAAAIVKLNLVQRYEIVPGLLGQELRDAGVHVEVCGNSDQRAVPSRSAVAIAMNSEGWVAGGDVGQDTLVSDPKRPFGVRADYEYLFRRLTRLKPGRNFVVVEAGDMGRTEAWSSYLTPERCEYFKRLSAVECGRFLTRLDDYLKSSSDRYKLFFVVAAPSAESSAGGDRLTPVIVTGTRVAAGLITSSTTRRPGLIASLDLAPTVLEFFGVQAHPSMLGGPVRVAAGMDSLSTLKAMNDQMVATFNARLPMLMGYVIFVGLSVLLAILAVVFHDRPAPGILELRNPRSLFVALMLAPAALLAAPGLGIYRALPSAAFVAVSTLVAACILNRRIGDSRLIFAVVGVVVSAALCADLLAGSPLLKRSILSYDPIAGIRFYGIGNESCGVLIGATLLGMYSLFDYRSRIRRIEVAAAAVVCAAVVVLIGSPKHGTNFGGTVAALCAFGFALVKAHGWTSWRKALVLTGACAFILFIVVLASNLALAPAGQSHIGRALEQARVSGPAVFLDIAIRKWSMNLRLIRYSIWTYILVSLLVGLAVLFYRPVGIVQRTLRKHPLMNSGFMGILVGIIVAMLTNDSGIAMAATGLLYLAVPLMFMVRAEMDAAPAASSRPAPAAQPLRE